MIRYIENPTKEMQEIAVRKNAKAIEYIENPSEDIMCEVVKNSWSALDYIKDPTDKVIKRRLKILVGLYNM